VKGAGRAGRAVVKRADHRRGAGGAAVESQSIPPDARLSSKKAISPP